MKTVVERFWNKVNKTKSCWEWQGALNSYGYGILRRSSQSGCALVHRLSWEIHHGPIPKINVSRGAFICHHCDNRKCINPKHLFLGTIYKNNKDRTNKKREARGIDSGRAKLDDRKVRLIRSLYKRPDVLQKDLAKRFGVNQTKISNVINKKTWAHVK